MNTNMNIDEIKKIIPHRYPFLLVDEVEELEPGRRAIGFKNVTANEPFFPGHFPDFPVMPGVLIVEALAQVGAIVMLSLPDNEGRLIFFGGIDKFRFKRQVRPGDRLKLEVEITKSRGAIGFGTAKAFVGDEVAAAGELMFAVGDASKSD